MPLNTVNKLVCKKCGDKIVSLYTHDFNTCSCSACSIDGGTDYCRTVGNLEDYEIIQERLEESEIEAGNERMGRKFDYDAYQATLKELRKR